MIENGSETEQIAVRAEARDLPQSNWSDKASGTKLFAAVNIRQMDLYDR
jgi:hypothetical protein